MAPDLRSANGDASPADGPTTAHLAGEAGTTSTAHASRTGADATLVAAVASGDERAMAALYDRHARLVWSVVRRLLGDESAAREVVQDVFVALWQNAPGYDPARSQVTTWLVHLARRRAIDRLRHDRALRRGGRDHDAPLDEAVAAVAAADDVAAAVLDAELAVAVRAALTQLPTQQRVLVELAFLHGYTHSELAERLGIAPGTIKTRLFRGLAKLRDELAPLVHAAPMPATVAAEHGKEPRA